MEEWDLVATSYHYQEKNDGSEVWTVSGKTSAAETFDRKRIAAAETVMKALVLAKTAVRPRGGYGRF